MPLRDKIAIRQFAILIIIPAVLSFPVIYNMAPAYWGTPDIQYVKAKVIRVLEGDLFADPVTGINNFHPPYYHLFLSFFVRIGIDIDTLLTIISVVNTWLLFLFGYLVLREIFGHITAIYSMLLVPFVFQYMGPGYAFLATAFYFSIPFYVAGLWLFLRTAKMTGLYSILWGIAFLISPVYLFLIGLTFLYLLVKKKYRSFLISVTIFLIMIIPFMIQAYTIYSSGLSGTAAFSFWRGIPDLKWLENFLIWTVSPAELDVFYWSVYFMLLLSALGIIGIYKSKKRHPLLIILGISYLLTAYHFNFGYASRILFFLSLFLGAYAVQYLKKSRILWAFLAVIIVSGLAGNINKLNFVYVLHNERFPVFEVQSRQFKQNFMKHVEPNSLILAYHHTYRYLIMTNFPVYGLAAYKSGEYFQLNGNQAKIMLSAYNGLMSSDNIEFIERVCREYGINTAVVFSTRDMEMPAFQAISKHWQLVYGDMYFRIYKRSA